MKGVTSITKEQINDVVETLFDKVAFHLLGNIPKLRNKKMAIFSSKPNYSLAQLFLSSLGSSPNPNDQEALKNLLSTAHNYIEALKNKTQAKLTEGVEAYIKEQRSQGMTPSSEEIKNIMLKELKSAGNHVKLIGEAEATKARNMGKALQIAKVGASQGQRDPMCFFIVVRDGVTCPECIRLHLGPDKMTPRVWKLSELGFQYHKKGEQNPKIMGLHPNCRCSLTFLAENYGFKDGKVSFIGEGHNELEKQRGES